MSGFGFKQRGFFGLLAGVAVVAAVGWGVWANYRGAAQGPDETEYAFGGWKYGREDQKTANAALVAAGLNDFRWDSGKLVVPPNKKSEYQSALAAANAYPKAPSETRREALREMSAFESDAKTRMRELDACAFQLERTIEQMSGVEYATVGVRARREQVGLTAKNVVTASVGVACKDGCSLDPNALSAITVATKHQLGVENAENISILDLKEGVSYFGTETSVGNANELGLAREEERIEKYWRAKLLDAFGYMKGVRASVAVELVAVRPEDRARERERAERERAERERVERTASAARSTRKIRSASYDERRTAARSDGRVRSRGAENSAESERSEAFASLGNPGAASFQTVSSTSEQNWARLGAPVDDSRSRRERRFGDGGVLTAAVDGRERNGGRVVLSGYAEKKSDNSAATEDLDDSDASPDANVAPALDETENDVALEGAPEKSNDAAFGRPIDARTNAGVGGSEYRVRSLSVAISAPSGYVWRVARTRTRRIDETGNEIDADFNDIYREAERDVVAETKRVAAALLKPLGVDAGWTTEETLAAIDVAVYSDCDDAPTTFGARRPESLNDGGLSAGLVGVEQIGVANVGTNDGDKLGETEETGETDGTLADGGEPTGTVRVAPTSAKVAEPSVVDGTDLGSTEQATGGFDGTISLFGRTFDLRRAANEPIVWGVAAISIGLLTIGVAVRTGRKRRERRRAVLRENDGESDEPEYSAKARTTNAANGDVRKTRNGSNDRANVEREEFDAEVDDLLEIASTRLNSRAADAGTPGTRAVDGGDRSKRRAAADLIAQNPERAATALRNWIKSDV